MGGLRAFRSPAAEKVQSLSRLSFPLALRASRPIPADFHRTEPRLRGIQDELKFSAPASLPITGIPNAIEGGPAGGTGEP